jgi:hypothetical protein
MDHGTIVWCALGLQAGGEGAHRLLITPHTMAQGRMSNKISSARAAKARADLTIDRATSLLSREAFQTRNTPSRLLDLAVAKNNGNPVYYAQYAHIPAFARCWW